MTSPTFDPTHIQIDAERLSDELLQLADFSDTPVHTDDFASAADMRAITRILFTPMDMKARDYVRGLAEEAGLTVRADAIGNMFLRWPGADAALTPVATGSHIDAIPFSGQYDGTIGVLGAIEALRALRRAGFQPQRSIDIIVFTSEEPTRFGLGCIGSRTLGGTLDGNVLAALEDDNDVTFDEARREVGYSGDIDSVPLGEGCYSAFVELHIEQGPELEAADFPIGAVTAIAAPAAFEVTVTGEGGHAGAVLMPKRRDALLGAAELALAVERAALETGSEDSVATVGEIGLYPSASNSIPSRAVLSIDARDTNEAARDAMLVRFREAMQEIANRRGVEFELDTINIDPPAPCDPNLVSRIERQAKALGLSTMRLVSRAYHDTLFMAQVCPVAMIFVPSQGGISHRPEEFTDPQEIAQGAHVLARVLAELIGESTADS